MLLLLVLEPLSPELNVLQLLALVLFILAEVILADREMSVRDNEPFWLLLVFIHLLFILIFRILFLQIFTILFSPFVLAVHVVVYQIVIAFVWIPGRDDFALLGEGSVVLLVGVFNDDAFGVGVHGGVATLRGAVVFAGVRALEGVAMQRSNKVEIKLTD